MIFKPIQITTPLRVLILSLNKLTKSFRCFNTRTVKKCWSYEGISRKKEFKRSNHFYLPSHLQTESLRRRWLLGSGHLPVVGTYADALHHTAKLFKRFKVHSCVWKANFVIINMYIIYLLILFSIVILMVSYCRFLISLSTLFRDSTIFH